MANYINKHIWGKWHQIGLVRRLFAIWFGLVVVMLLGLMVQVTALSRLARVVQPLSGGTYREAAVGTVKILSPILPESSISSDINRLIFSGLTQYDNNRRLVADLATSWSTSADGKTYTFKLRRGVKWHDGVPFTSADVAFTIAAIQNPDTRSPLATSWQGVKVSTPDDYTVVYTLPAALTPFLDSTTIGIVPRHLLESIEPSAMRETGFNQSPVGTGPFKMSTFSPKAGEVLLASNSTYFARKPRLDNYLWRFYETPDMAQQAYVKQDVDAISRIDPANYAAALKLSKFNLTNYSVPNESVLFFRLGEPTLADLNIRTAITRSLDRKKLISKSGDSQGVPLTQPILPGQLGYTTKYAANSYDTSKAAVAFAAAGWRKDRSGILAKDGKQLKLTLVTLADSHYARLAEGLQDQLKQAGVVLTIKTVELQELQQSYIRPRNYQLLLYGLNIGADPDVYAYWHSSQIADPGLNLSQYKSVDTDRALESGRIKQDLQIRQGKYDTFLKTWNADMPAFVIGTSPYLYGHSQSAYGILPGQIVEPSNRFYRVERWTIKTRFGRP